MLQELISRGAASVSTVYLLDLGLTQSVISLPPAVAGEVQQGEIEQNGRMTATQGATFAFLRDFLSEIDRKVWEREGRTCSKGPWAGIKPGSLQSGLSLKGTLSTC